MIQKTRNGQVKLTRKGMVTIVLDSSFDLSLYATVWSVFRSVEICRLQGVLSAYTMVSKELFMLAACSGSCWHLKLHCVGFFTDVHSSFFL